MSTAIDFSISTFCNYNSRIVLDAFFDLTSGLMVAGLLSPSITHITTFSMLHILGTLLGPSFSDLRQPILGRWFSYTKGSTRALHSFTFVAGARMDDLLFVLNLGQWSCTVLALFVVSFEYLLAGGDGQKPAFPASVVVAYVSLASSSSQSSSS